MKFDSDLTAGTVVTFAGGSLRETARLVFAARHEGGWIVVTDRSPVHPVSLSWPDQPADHGTIVFADGTQAAISDAWSGLLDIDTGTVLAGDAARAIRRGEGNHKALVLHIVVSDDDLSARVGSEVTVSADPELRRALSLNHSGVHLAALALNRAAGRFWTKEYSDLDSFGVPNFDKAAVEASDISTVGSTDGYRIGKSLRKKGFDRDSFIAALPEVTSEVNQTVQTWIASGAAMTLTPGEGELDGLRLWQITLDGTDVTIPCGGTHVASLRDIRSVSIALEERGEGFIMTARTAGV